MPTLDDLRQELVDDRALADVDHDRLGHRDVVDELEQLVCATELPASIALYGPWGSGKSSLANLLRERMGSRKIPFARFDAFKYAEAPMRRLFLSQVARELGVTGDPSNPEDKEAEKEKYESGLYTEVSYNTVTLPDAKVRRLIYVFLCVVGLGVLAIAAVLALVAIALDGPWSHAYSELLLAALPAGAIAAALIASVAAFANQTLPVNRKRSSPSSEDEFERLFRDLVKEVDAERIVIFIDELDRCSSREVVGTLETIRTFLEVKPCVVIVAADQQVLERALRRQARQETPYDSRNPYYSSGSAYLDKIFNFQVALPPLRSRRLSDFALELVDGLGGLWKEVDLGMVLLALIPTHVRSLTEPRGIAVEFTDHGLLSEQGAAIAFLADLQSVLGEPAVSDPDAAGASALELVEAYGSEAPSETLRAVLEAAIGSQWLTQPAGSNLSLSLAAAIVDSGEEVECPVGYERVVELADLGTAGAPAVGAWLGAFAASSEEVYAVLARLAHMATIPDPIADGLSRWSEREGAGEALWVAQRYYEEHGLPDPPDDGLLAALGSCEPDEEQVSEWLLKLFESANTNEERKGVMVAWRGFEPSDPSIRRRLITEVFLRLGEEYKGGFKLALKNIGLVADPPYGVKGEIKKTLRHQAKKHNLHNAAERALEEAGIDKAQIGLRDRIRREDSLDD